MYLPFRIHTNIFNMYEPQDLVMFKKNGDGTMFGNKLKITVKCIACFFN